MNRTEQLWRSLYPFESHFLNLDGLRYHYLDEGEGDPVVMVHGNPTWSFYYRELVKALRSSHRCIVPDHIGCGLSDKPDDHNYDYCLESRVGDLEALLDRLALTENITLVLHDWGGMIGMACALRRPQRIRRLVLFNTAAFLLPKSKKLPFRLTIMRHRNPLSTLAVRGFNLFSRAATSMATRKGLSPEVRAGLTAPYDSWQNRVATLRFVQDIPLSPEDRSYELVKSVDRRLDQLAHVPMLICWGEHDFVFDRHFLKEWQRRFPSAEIHTFPDAGHYVVEDACEQIIPLVQGFLSRHPLQGRSQKKPASTPEAVR
ncbi:MAG: alpha/beta fold hydrolase [Phycisphaerales bacterium]|nr:alpha/beta fold hydrolase [Phycisphaerales bacterium]